MNYKKLFSDYGYANQQLLKLEEFIESTKSNKKIPKKSKQNVLDLCYQMHSCINEICEDFADDSVVDMMVEDINSREIDSKTKRKALKEANSQRFLLTP